VKLKTRYIVLIILLILIVVGIFVFRSFVRQAEAGLEQLSSMELATPNLAAIPDGRYVGSYEAFPVKVEVAVTVSEHMIKDIELLKHRNGQGKAAEAIIDRIVEQQSVELDVVSGATYSSLVILKSVEQALAE